MSDDLQKIWDRMAAYEFLLTAFLANAFARMSEEQSSAIKLEMLNLASHPAPGHLMSVETLQSRELATRENLKAILMKVVEQEAKMREAIVRDRNPAQ